MNDNKKYPKWNLIVLIIQILIAGSTFGINWYFYSKNLQIAEESRRADISIFVVDWTRMDTPENITLTVSGHIHNEGVRDAVVKTLSVGMKFSLESGDEVQLSHILSGYFGPMIGWQNLTLMSKQMKEFSITNETYTLTDYLGLANKKPDEGSITVSYDDGIGIKEQTRVFSLKYFP
jgi:hypothetical protein